MKHIPTILIIIIILLIIKKRFFDNTDYKSMLDNDGIIVDVRTENEFLTGNIENSINIPLSEISSKVSILKDKNKPIITCCASGMRSATAKQILKASGYTNVVNGGGWKSLEKKLKK
tara:strand:+ start:1398 stop:1748 length:351 start_codon:yes stop_codon:yes gene_type:complete